VTAPSWLSQIWHLPSTIWRGMLAAAHITLWWRFGAAVVVSLMAALVIWIFWQGTFWPKEAWSVRGQWLGWFGILLIAGMLISVAFLFGRELELAANKDGITIRTGDDDHEPVKVTASATVEVPKAADGDDDPTRFGGPRE